MLAKCLITLALLTAIATAADRETGISGPQAQLAQPFNGPLLIILGGRDQTGRPDSNAPKVAPPNVRMHAIQEADQLFVVVSVDRAANLAAYYGPSLPFAPGIADVVTAAELPRK